MEQVAKIEVYSKDGMDLRSMLIAGEPWFVAADVCRALDLGNVSQALTRLDADETALISNEGREINAVSEAGLYSLVLGSRKPEAKTFKRWVTHEVLPAIRKTGTYAAPKQDWGGRALPKSFSEALHALAAEVEQNEAMAKQIAEDAPKVAAHAEYMDSDGTFLIRNIAKALPSLGMGQNQMYAALRARSIIMANSTEPYQRYVDAGYFVRKAGTFFDPKNNVTRPTMTTRVTPRGKDFIFRIFSNQVANA